LKAKRVLKSWKKQKKKQRRMPCQKVTIQREGTFNQIFKGTEEEKDGGVQRTILGGKLPKWGRKNECPESCHRKDRQQKEWSQRKRELGG